MIPMQPISARRCTAVSLGQRDGSGAAGDRAAALRGVRRLIAEAGTGAHRFLNLARTGRGVEEAASAAAALAVQPSAEPTPQPALASGR